MRVAIVCTSSNLFLKAIDKIIASGGHNGIRFADDVATAQIETWGPDVIWCEWALGHAARITNETRLPVIVRLHRFEVFEPIFDAINWTRVKLLIVGSTEILDLARKRAPAIRNLPTLVCPAPLDLDDWKPPAEAPDGFKIGVVANMDPRKNPFAWLDVLGQLPREFSMHVVGDMGSGWMREWMTHASKPFGPRLSFYGPLPHGHLPKFWEDKSFCLCAGMHETAGPAAAVEAAAMGVRPVVYEYASALAFWGSPEALWRTTAEAASLIRYDPKPMIAAWRGLVLPHSWQARAGLILDALKASCA